VPQVQGAVVVIDVLRAFSTAAYAFGAGASHAFIVASAAEAHALRERFPEAVLAGEVGGRAIDGFDFGNSPADVSRADLRGRPLVLRSSSGTQGVVQAFDRADTLLLGSLAVAGATVGFLNALQPQNVTVLAMGSPRGPDGDEDVACGDYMRALLGGSETDASEIVRRVRESPAGLQALDPTLPWISPEDLACAVDIDRFPFAMLVRREGDLLVARTVDPEASQ
jgi:2-phosphosulfolactate phosphatase